jgi:acetylglutamate kinase
MTHVLKVSGADLDDADFSRRLAEVLVHEAQADERPLLVHGGGKEITELLKAMNIPSSFIEGLRVTDAATRDVALMVLAGLANKRMVAHVLNAGGTAVGLSGVDGRLLQVRPIDAALGFVGKPCAVNTTLLEGFLSQGVIPVINPMSIGEQAAGDGEIYNVNADHAAGAIAAALDADLLTFVTNVPGVLDGEKKLLPQLSATETDALIASGVITVGMIPKVRTCLEALQAGVRRVRITNLEGLRTGGGTIFVTSQRP